MLLCVSCAFSRPVGSLAPHIDPYDSLASLMPQAEGFQSISSFLGTSPSPSSHLVSSSPNLDSIAEVESPENEPLEDPANNHEVGTRVSTTSETDATALDPFPNNGREVFSESPEIDESGPVALAAIENFNHTSSSAPAVESGFGTTMPSADPYQFPPEYIYKAGDPPPLYSSDGNSTSPLFSGRFDSPLVPGKKVTQPVSSSTPLDRDESHQTTTLRQRDIHRNSDT